jgi:hypothetical protein
MRQGEQSAAAWVVIGLLGSCRPAADPRGLDPRNQVATLVALGGEVDVLRSGAVDWAPIGAGSALYDDDRVRTFHGAWAQLRFAGGSTLRVQEASLISLGGGVTIERGTVAGELQAGLKLRTPAAEAESAPARDIVFR